MQRLLSMFRPVAPLILFLGTMGSISASIYDISPEVRASREAAADRASNERMVFTAVTGVVVVAIVAGGVAVYRRK